MCLEARALKPSLICLGSGGAEGGGVEGTYSFQGEEDQPIGGGGFWRFRVWLGKIVLSWF